jgi:carboxypeptidase Taq
MENSILQQLKSRLREVHDLERAGAVLYWDQATYMPPGGSPERGRQLGTIAQIAQEKFTDPAVGKSLDQLQSLTESLPHDDDDASLVRVTRREYDRAIKVPPSFIAEVYQHITTTYQAWAQARPENDFEKMIPFLEKSLDLSRKMAGFFPGYDHIADPLIDLSDYGMKATEIRKIFSSLQEELVPLAKKISSLPPVDDSCLRRRYPHDQQMFFGERVIRQFGFDFGRGRQDKSPHPFTIKLSMGDVRITTRIKEDDFAWGFFSTTHEAGHAMYEQGVNPEFEGTPLDGGTSSGVHESQSRTWENIISRSLSFWEFFYPKLRETFPDALEDVPMEDFYRAINKVQPSLIRTEADEVTYNLHVMIRFELEMQLLEGTLAIKDLPEAWHKAYNTNLGIQAPSDTDGCMQDSHWYSGLIGGAFQGYTLGNIMSTQFFDQALASHPEIESEMAKGEFQTLHNWLKENIHQHGKKYTASELIKRVTGKDLDISPYIQYLKNKFGTLYSL